MTTVAAVANVNDAYLFAGSTSYATALNGTAAGVSDVSDTTLFVGQQKSGANYTIWQAYLEFGYTALAESACITAHVRLYSSSTTGTNVSRGIDIQKYDWGASLTGADWRKPAQLNLALNNRIASVDNVQNAGTGLALRAGINAVDLYDASGTFRYVIDSTANRLSRTPSGQEYNGFRSGNYNGGGTGFSPTLMTSEIQNSRLSRGLGAQVQLSDGSHMFLEFDSHTIGQDSNTLVRRTPAGVVTRLTYATNQSSTRRGAQAYSMCRDTRDNVYVINQSDSFNAINCRVFTKSGTTWVAGTIRTGTLPTHEGGNVNQVACTWHPQGGTYGTIVAIVGHRAGANNGTQLAYALINCDYLVTGKGSLFRGTGNAENKLVAFTSTDGFNNFANDTGTLLDITAATVGSARGFVMSTARHHVLGANSGQSLARYTLNASGTGFAESWTFYDTVSGFSVKDANAKSRILPISDTQYVTVNVSPSTGFGIVVKHRQQQDSQFNVLAEARLDAQGISSMGTPADYATANNWDAVYNPLDHRVWVYYFDKANPNRLMRTHVDLNTGQAGNDQIQVATGVGAAGSSNLAIRVHRHHTIGEQVLISVANRTSGGVHSPIYVADNINVAPSQPTLLTKANFDAATPATFQWNFNDLNKGDSQSFARVQIDNNTTGAPAWENWSLNDTFTRTVTGGWGNANTGQAWTVTGTASDYSVSSGVGAVAMSAINSSRLSLIPSPNANVDMVADITTAAAAAGAPIISGPVLRATDNNNLYHCRLDFNVGGSITASLRSRVGGTETILATYSATFTHTPGAYVRVRFQAIGSNLRARLWQSGSAEPTEWHLTATDSAIASGPSIGFRSFASSGSTNTLPVMVNFANMQVMGGNTVGSYSLPGSSIANEENYRWRVMTWDRAGEPSPWSDYGFFTTSASGVANIIDPATDNDPDIVTANYLVRWGVSGTTQAAYRVLVTRNDTGATLVDTGWVTSTATQYLVEGMLSDIEWKVSVTVRDSALVSSNTATRLITPNYNAPEVPIVTFDVADDSGYIQLNITNPDPVGDRPNPTKNQIQRRVYSATNPDGLYEVLGEVEPNAPFKDFTAASGVLYEYRVRAIAGEYFTDSTPTIADRELQLQGVWIHDPIDPAVTVRQFFYGKDNRSTSLDIKGTTQQFAGRVFPVTDFGEHEEEDLSITVDIPHGPTHRTEEDDLRGFAEARRTLYLRDNRGRACYGTMSGYQQSDQSWGVTVGFKFGRASYVIEEV